MGVRRRLDIFGVLVLSYAAANAGGILRDLLIGAIPPVAINDWRYLAVSVLAGILTFYCNQHIDRLHSKVLLCDAVGLSLFAVAGTHKALAFDLGPVPAVMLGMLTGIGGGMVRDILVAEIPTVLKADFYALAALVGAVVVVIGHELDLPSFGPAVLGGFICFALRFLAIRRKWRLPIAEAIDESTLIVTAPTIHKDKDSGYSS